MSPYVSNSISIFNEGPKMPSQPKAGQTFDESRSDFSALDFQQRTSPISTSYSPIKILSSNFFLNGSPMLETLEGSHSKDPTGPTSTFENPTYFLDADRKATKILSNNGLSQITENEDDENLDYQYKLFFFVNGIKGNLMSFFTHALLENFQTLHSA